MALGSAADAINAAVYSRLSGDATLLATATGGVHDDVFDATSFPYVQIGDTIETPWDAFGNQGRTNLVTIHTWSQYQGAKESWTMISRIIALLDRYALSVSGVTLTRCVHERSMVLRDPDGKTRHGVVEFRVEVSES
jgi:hypothetical protein